jgi:septum formation protein
MGMQARTFIKGYSNSFSSTVGSVLVTNLRTGKRAEGVDTAKIFFKDIPESIINQLIQEGGIFNCAGGLMIEHPLVTPLITKIHGTTDSIMGLPKVLLLECLVTAAG